MKIKAEELKDYIRCPYFWFYKNIRKQKEILDFQEYIEQAAISAILLEIDRTKGIVDIERIKNNFNSEINKVVPGEWLKYPQKVISTRKNFKKLNIKHLITASKAIVNAASGLRKGNVHSILTTNFINVNKSYVLPISKDIEIETKIDIVVNIYPNTNKYNLFILGFSKYPNMLDVTLQYKAAVKNKMYVHRILYWKLDDNTMYRVRMKEFKELMKDIRVIAKNIYKQSIYRSTSKKCTSCCYKLYCLSKMKLTARKYHLRDFDGEIQKVKYDFEQN